MTSKERANLRGQANSLEVLYQIGKGGINDAFIEQTKAALKKRELIKLKVLLESSPVSPREAAEEIAAKTESEVVQVIGGCMIFYKYNPELHKDEKKKKPAAKKLSDIKGKRR
ncbi:MAG: YhbY family RNA-binding protein [Ruminococcaceae bacterium]|nr:YhbY family RNA-binding protein [Oscillospiraceae bacterium]